MTHQRRTLLAAVAAAAIATSASLSVSAAEPAAEPKPVQAAYVEQVVYHIDNMASARKALSNAVNHLEASPKAKIKVLANGDGIFMLMAGEKDKFGEYAEAISELQAKGVTFIACRNTMEHRKLDASKLLPSLEVVPAGFVELARLQIAEHYAYIKP